MATDLPKVDRDSERLAIKRELEHIYNSCLRIAATTMLGMVVFSVTTLITIGPGFVAAFTHLVIFFAAFYLLFRSTKIRWRVGELLIRLDLIDQTNGSFNTAEPKDSPLFFAWEIFSILLPKHLRITQWLPSHWELKVEYLMACQRQTSVHRQRVLWCVFAIKSTVVWAQCWWNYLPLQLRIGLPIVLSIAILKFVAASLGVY